MKEDVGLSTLLELLTHGDAATSAKAKVTADCGGISRVRPFGQITLADNNRLYRREQLDRQAQSIHKRYCNSGAPPNQPSTKHWHELAEDFKDSNRQQADHIDYKARAIHCKVVDEQPSAPIYELSRDEVELLAKMEHRRWCANAG